AVSMVLATGFSATSAVRAEHIFHVRATAPGETAEARFSKFEDLFESVRAENIDKLLSNYTDTSAAVLQMDVRGLPALASYAPNSPTLTFRIPSLNISETFTGRDRDESE